MICTDEQILNFLIVLETLKIAYIKDSCDGNWGEFDYEHKEDVIEIKISWASYEEGADNNFTITLNESSIEMTQVEEGTTVYGEIDSTNTKTFNSLEEVGNYLISYFNL